MDRSFLLCAILTTCAGGPQASDSAQLTPPAKNIPSATVELNIPQAQNVTALSDAPVISITESEVLFNQVKVVDISQATAADKPAFDEKAALIKLINEEQRNPIEALAKKINDFEGRNDRLLIEADKETSPQVLFNVLRSAAWAGYSQPDFVVRGTTSQQREQLAITKVSQDAVLATSEQEVIDPKALGLFGEPSAGDCHAGVVLAPYGVWSRGPNLTEGKAIITGRRDKESVRQVIRQASTLLIGCYEDALKTAPALSGGMVVSFQISADGSVESPRAKKSLSKDVDDCVADKISQLSFPAVSGGTASVTYPFLFERPKRPTTTLTPNETFVLRVGGGGFEIFSGGRPDPWGRRFVVDDKLASISKTDGEDNYEELYTQLKKLKEQNPSHNALIIITQDAHYGALIQAADTSIKAGLSSIFFVPSKF